jgi:hypothetical protein
VFSLLRAHYIQLFAFAFLFFVFLVREVAVCFALSLVSKIYSFRLVHVAFS